MSDGQHGADRFRWSKRRQDYEDAATSVLAAQRVALADIALGSYGHLVEMSHIARLAATRLEQISVGQNASERGLTAVKAMLQEIEKVGQQAFLKRYGARDDYETAGIKIDRRYRAPNSRWLP